MTDIRVAAEQARVALKHICTHSPRTPRVIDADWDNARAALASLEAALAALPGDTLPDVLFDGYSVLGAMDARALMRTSPENVSDVLDAVVRLLRHPAAPSSSQVPQIAGRDGASDGIQDESGSSGSEHIEQGSQGERRALPAAAPSDEGEPEYELHCNDEWAAAASGRGAAGEIMHYANQYEADGPVAVYEVRRRLVYAAPPRQVAHSSQAQGELSVNAQRAPTDGAQPHEQGEQA